MDATLDSEDIALLNQLSDKQKDYALTLYTAREKKKSTAYILWILSTFCGSFSACTTSIWATPSKTSFSGSSASVSSEKSGGSWTSSACPAW